MTEILDQGDNRTEEDRIIETLFVEGLRRLYDDSDFLPIRQSLYNVENVVPIYDDEISQQIMWCRPQVIDANPVYFNNSPQIGVIQGNLPDEVFISALMAVATFQKYDLIENVFSSRPDDFKNYGVFTCRFYVEGDWVEVITDTNVPCIRDENMNTYQPVYSRSLNPNEMWICLAEKAYAKAVGSYEAIPRVRIQEALMHLTGGSVQQMTIQDESNSNANGKSLWTNLKSYLSSNTLLLASPIDPAMTDSTKEASSKPDIGKEESTSAKHGLESKRVDRFLLNRYYSIVAFREIGDLHLLLFHNPWTVRTVSSDSESSSTETLSSEVWFGHWSNSSPLWEMYPDIYDYATENLKINWTKKNPNGYFWISLEDFKRYFNSVFSCKLFPTSQYKFYCIKDEWREKLAGGPLLTVRDKSLALKDAMESKRLASNKASFVTVIDGDCSWFNNPQVRIHSAKSSEVFISLLPLSADKDGGSLTVGIDVVATKKAISGVKSDQLHIWDCVLSDIVATDKTDNSNRIKGQEASIWELTVDSSHCYHILPHTMKRGQEVVEQIPSVYHSSLFGEWYRNHDIDTTGGRLTYKVDNHIVENSKWCQNPQYHLELQDLFSKDELKLKIVVRRTDSKDKSSAFHRTNSLNDKNQESYIGMVICRAECLEENVLKNKLKKQPKLSAVGEIIPSKVSTLKKKSVKNIDDDNQDIDPMLPHRKDTFDITKIPRKYFLSNDPQVFESTYSSKHESCIYMTKISRSSIPQGLLIIPSLQEKGMKGSFEIEVYSSEPIVLKQLPDHFNKSIASEWTEQNACGSHVNPNWKKNPKFAFHFRHTSKTLTNSTRIPLRITLGRYGQTWNTLMKKDTVGCMIGFYIFIQRSQTQELQQIYESLFIPGDELSTDSSFTLTPLPIGDEYIIMPTTFSEGKIGSFVLSIMTEAEFKFHKDKA